jgi:hypothetical protein
MLFEGGNISKTEKNLENPKEKERKGKCRRKLN